MRKLFFMAIFFMASFNIRAQIVFEALLFLAAEAYETKTQKPFIHTPKYNYETYSNEEGWA